MFKLRLTYLAIAAGLVAGAACSKDDTHKRAENAAENVGDKVDDLQDQAKDLKETANDNADELADKTKSNVEALKEHVDDTVDDLNKRAADTADKAKDNVEDLADETKDMSEKTIAARDAQKEFEYQRLVRIDTLRGVHAIAASQPALLDALSASLPLVDNARANVNEKVSVLMMRLDASANAVLGLEGVNAANWKDRERAAADAMNKLEDARKAAWDALDDADRLDRTSMR